MYGTTPSSQYGSLYGTACYSECGSMYGTATSSEYGSMYGISSEYGSMYGISSSSKFGRYIVCQANSHGVLVLSEFTGAAQALGAGCVRVNPYNPEDVARGIYQAPPLY